MSKIRNISYQPNTEILVLLSSSYINKNETEYIYFGTNILNSHSMPSYRVKHITFCENKDKDVKILSLSALKLFRLLSKFGTETNDLKLLNDEFELISNITENLNLNNVLVNLDNFDNGGNYWLNNRKIVKISKVKINNCTGDTTDNYHAFVKLFNTEVEEYLYFYTKRIINSSPQTWNTKHLLYTKNEGLKIKVKHMTSSEIINIIEKQGIETNNILLLVNFGVKGVIIENKKLNERFNEFDKN